MSVELCSELMKKPKNKQVIPKFFIIYLHIFESLTWSASVVGWKPDYGFPVISFTIIVLLKIDNFSYR